MELVLQPIFEVLHPIEHACILPLVSHEWHTIAKQFTRKCVSREQFIEHACATMSMSLLEWHTQREELKHQSFISRVIHHVGYDHMTTKYLINYERAQLSDIAYNGRSDVIKWIFDNCKITPNDIKQISASAARGGHLDFALALLDKFSDCDVLVDMRNNAVKGGHLHVLEALMNRLSDAQDEIIEAKERGYISLLECYSTYTLSCIVTLAASCGHLHILKWINKNGYANIDAFAIRAAANNGHQDILTWMRYESGALFEPRDWTNISV